MFFYMWTLGEFKGTIRPSCYSAEKANVAASVILSYPSLYLQQEQEEHMWLKDCEFKSQYCLKKKKT